MVLVVELIGDMLFINQDGVRTRCIPTNSNTWIVSASSTPGSGGPTPGPGGSDLGYAPPFPYSDVTSEYGPRDGRFHEGIDFSGASSGAGTNIPAIGKGKVEQVQTSHPGFGNMVIIDHGIIDGHRYRSLYAHMQSGSIAVSVNDNVNKGQTVGKVGNTGASYGAHLHLEIHKTLPNNGIVFDNYNPSYSSNRSAINPRTFFSQYGSA